MSQGPNTLNFPEAGPVEVWFKLVKAADGYPESQDWEELWARPVSGAYRLESIPFFENRVSRGDLITASAQEDGFLKFETVVERGGHSTFRALVDLDSGGVESFMTELKRLGADCEVTLENLVAIDVPPNAMTRVEEFLLRGKDDEKWGLQDGFIFESTTGETVTAQ